MPALPGAYCANPRRPYARRQPALSLQTLPHPLHALAQDKGYDEEVRLQALSLYLDGLSLREISRLLSVNHQSVANWINDYATHMPPNLPPSILEIAILDGFYTPPTRPRRRKISASAPTDAV